MTYRIYARWADGKVSDKTTTESRTVADFAWSELCKIRWEDTNKPEGLTYTSREGREQETRSNFLCGFHNLMVRQEGICFRF